MDMEITVTEGMQVFINNESFIAKRSPYDVCDKCALDKFFSVECDTVCPFDCGADLIFTENTRTGCIKELVTYKYTCPYCSAEYLSNNSETKSRICASCGKEATYKGE